MSQLGDINFHSSIGMSAFMSYVGLVGYAPWLCYFISFFYHVRIISIFM